MNLELMNIKEITKYIDGLDIEKANINLICTTLELDKRKSVNLLGRKLKNKLSKFENELVRLKKMYSYENRLYNKGIYLIAGLDEVGRGPLSGPVVSAAVILPVNCKLTYLNDSKKLSEKKRNRLYHQIMTSAIDVAIGMASPSEIDDINILNASKLSMKRAVEALNFSVDHLLVDALDLKDIKIDQTSIVKGDEKSASIAAASIVAKVTRDHIMVENSRFFKGYGFERNKGYGTSEHLEALKSIGPVSIHRKTFIKGILGGENN